MQCHACIQCCAAVLKFRAALCCASPLPLLLRVRPSCSGGSASDPLGLQPATAPALAVLDKLYATQVCGRGGGAGGSVLAVNSAVKVSYSGSASMAPVGARWPGSGTSA